jgi:adenylate cyclase
MIDMADIDRIEDWLIGQALHSPNIPEMFGELCNRLTQCGVPVQRAVLAWRTLHPLIRAETARWESGSKIHHEQFAHSDELGDNWTNSPMRSALEDRKVFLRRRLEGGNAELDFPLCVELASMGYTDYLVIATSFDIPAISDPKSSTGIIVSWTTRNPGGFTDDQVLAIEYIQKRLALAAKANFEAQITRTIAETYLGRWAGSRVLNGQIRHGDGETIKAVIFYCDMRNSTRIAEALGPNHYLQFLNSYFNAMGGPILEQGGEILDFIGDAVLGVFPINELGLEEAVTRAINAADEARHRLVKAQAGQNAGHPLNVGIALSVGEVMFGNIGVANRLTFSVIGQTVHAAARVEQLTKTAGQDTLMTEEVAAYAGGRSMPVGSFTLDGFSGKQPLFALTETKQ